MSSGVEAVLVAGSDGRGGDRVMGGVDGLAWPDIAIGTEMSLPAVVDVLKALGEPTRLRIAALLRHGELTVSDVTEILGQSQPRVSRHLKQLADAGIVERRREGAWAFFRLADGNAATLVAAALAHVDDTEAGLLADLERLEVVREARADVALRYFERIAPIWDEERSLHASDAAVEATILELLGAPSAGCGRLVDLGTGTGRMLRLLAGRADRAVGLDTSHSMLSVARAHLERADGTGHWELRQGDVYRPPLEPASFDLALLHQVLHHLDEPARAIAEAVRLLAPGGRLLVVDFAPHHHEFLRADHAHRRLGFGHDEVRRWMDQAGMRCTRIRDLDPPTDTDGLVVTVWLATDARSSGDRT